MTTMKDSAAPTMSLFFDGSADSQRAKRALEQSGARCSFYDTRSLRISPGDQIAPPILYAPEGIFNGWSQIQTLLQIPPEMRFDALRAARK